MDKFFKAIAETDPSPIVICGTDHKILYMNPAAITHYAQGAALLDRSVLQCHNPRSAQKLEKILAWFLESKSHNIFYIAFSETENADFYMIALRDADGTLLGYYEKVCDRTPDPNAPHTI